MSILLFNPNELPYGDLSPLKDHIISKSYASIVDKEMIKKEVESLNNEAALKKAIAYFTSEQDQLYFSALKEALDYKYRDGLALQELLNVKEDYMVYLSDNLALGLKNKEGDNFVGKYLNEIRKNARLKQEKDFVNKVYSIYTVFKNEILSGKNKLEKYVGLSVDDVLKLRSIENEPIEIRQYNPEKEEKERHRIVLKDMYAKMIEEFETSVALYEKNYGTSFYKKLVEKLRENLRGNVMDVQDFSKKIETKKFENEMYEMFKEKEKLRVEIERLEKLEKNGVKQETNIQELKENYQKMVVGQDELKFAEFYKLENKIVEIGKIRSEIEFGKNVEKMKSNKPLLFS